MKKAILLILIFGTAHIFIFAQDANYDEAGTNLGMPIEICTVTSEPCKLGESSSSLGGSSGQMARYKCCVSSEDGFTDFVSSIYKYIFFISLVLGILYIVVMGIGYSASGLGSEELKAKAKEKFTAVVIGLLALALVPWMLKTVAPFFFQ